MLRSSAARRATALMTGNIEYFERLLSALPNHAVAKPRWAAPPRFPTWRWPLPRSYNGFTGIERVRGWQVSRWLEACGALTRPTRCDICMGQDRPAFHSETYYHIARAPAICHRCHRALHRRQREWAFWQSLAARHAVTGREWWCLLRPEPVDLAAHLRETSGWQAADLFRSLLERAPKPITDLLPSNMLAHPMITPLLACPRL